MTYKIEALDKAVHLHIFLCRVSYSPAKKGQETTFYFQYFKIHITSLPQLDKEDSRMQRGLRRI